MKSQDIANSAVMPTNFSAFQKIPILTTPVTISQAPVVVNYNKILQGRKVVGSLGSVMREMTVSNGMEGKVLRETFNSSDSNISSL